MNKKKICLVTSEESFCNNFGAALQGYALYSVLNQHFGECKILRYDSLRAEETDSAKTKKYKTITISKIIQYINRKSYYLKYKKDIKLRGEKFKAFEKNVRFVDDVRYNISSIKNLTLDYDVLVCGSDQIWNPVYKGNKNDPVYFLDFGDKKCKRIAYAPSIGVTDLPKQCSLEFVDLVNKIDYLSVREKTGQRIIKNMMDKTVPVLPDPTFLLSKEEWSEIQIKPNINTDYIVLYRFMDSDFIDAYITRISSMYKLKIITLPMYFNKKDDKYERKFDIGPAEFIGLIKNASIVCTESFHATVFSIIFEIPFIAFPRKDLKKNGDSRIFDLLEQLNLTKRFYNDGDPTDIESLIDNEDIIEAHDKLEKFKKLGLEYLRSAFDAENRRNC